MVVLIRLDKQNMHPNLSPHLGAGRLLALLLIAMHLRSTALLSMLPLLRCLVTRSMKCLKRLRNKFPHLLNRPLPHRHPRRFHAPLLHPMRTLSDSAGEMSLSVWPRTAGLRGACCPKMGNWAPLTETSWSSSFPAKGWSQALQTGDAHRSWRTRSMTSFARQCTGGTIRRWTGSVNAFCQCAFRCGSCTGRTSAGRSCSGLTCSRIAPLWAGQLRRFGARSSTNTGFPCSGGTDRCLETL